MGENTRNLRLGGVLAACASARVRRRALSAALVATAALVAFALATASAQAFSQRGHEFESSFGESGEPANPAKPSAIAVNETSGDVYVVESANNRVAVYGPAPEHKFIEFWGFGVANGEKKYETCSSGCKVGLAGTGTGAFDAPPAIAVDNSAGPTKGDVYVVANRGWKKAAVDEFSANGKLLGNLITKEEKEEEIEQTIVGVAVDNHGTVWLEREAEEEDFSLEQYAEGTLRGRSAEPKEFEVLEETNAPLSEWFDLDKLAPEELEELEPVVHEVGELKRPARPGFAIDSTGAFYLTYEPFGHDYDEISEHEKFEHKEALAAPCVEHSCFAEKFQVPSGSAGVGEAVSPTLVPKLDDENTTGIATDISMGEASNDVYADNGTSVAAFNSEGALIQRFATGQLGDDGGSGLAVDGATGEVLVADATGGRIDAYVSEKAGVPVIEPGSLRFAHGQSTSVELRASVDPNGGAEPHAVFEYGTASCATSTCSTQAPTTALKEGFGEQPISVQLTGLAPSTTYHFRVSASNSFGPAVIEEEGTFTTQPSAVQASMLDGRAWELVSPGEKHGASISPVLKEGGLIQAAASGKAIAYTATAPIGENAPQGYTGGPSVTEILGTRSPDTTHWSAEDMATERGSPAKGLNVGGPWEYQFFESELKTAFVNPFSSVPPSLANVGAPEYSVYLRNDTTCATDPATCYELLVGANQESIHLEDATTNLEHIVLLSGVVPLTSNAAAGQPGLYEWSRGGQLKLVSVLPTETQATGGKIGAGSALKFEAHANAVSENGARVVWSFRPSAHEAGVIQRLYVRETPEGTTTETTLPVDEVDSGASGLGVANPLYQGANATDSRIFFTDTQRLTTNADSGRTTAEERDLYVFEPQKPAGQRVTDLTPALAKAEPAAVQGALLGTSTDGSYAYFVANGVLAAGAEPGDCREEAPADAGCSLYVVHHGSGGWEAPRFIARLSEEDAPGWGFAEGKPHSEYIAQAVSSRVSPNGEYVAFMSSRSLTGYDNIDANSGSPDEEVYLYHYETAGLACVSCNPSGEPPVGVYDKPTAGEGEGLLVDRPEWWGAPYGEENQGVDDWLAGSLPGWTTYGFTTATSASALYQPRNLSDSGRLFFDSADALVPLARPTREETVHGEELQAGVENVYEYEPHTTGSCSSDNTAGGCVELISSGESDQESAFLDASTNGEDVFFLTDAKLSPLDTDTTFDLYDARVCKETSEPCPTPPPESSSSCTGESGKECRSVSEDASSFGAPASASSSGSGNIVAKGQVLDEKKVEKAKAPLTRAQKLAAALKQCHKLKKKKKRVACEKQAHKKYPAPSSKKKSKKKS